MLGDHSTVEDGHIPRRGCVVLENVEPAVAGTDGILDVFLNAVA